MCEATWLIGLLDNDMYELEGWREWSTLLELLQGGVGVVDDGKKVVVF